MYGIQELANNDTDIVPVTKRMKIKILWHYLLRAFWPNHSFITPRNAHCTHKCIVLQLPHISTSLNPPSLCKKCTSVGAMTNGKRKTLRCPVTIGQLNWLRNYIYVILVTVCSYGVRLHWILSWFCSEEEFNPYPANVENMVSYY